MLQSVPKLRHEPALAEQLPPLSAHDAAVEANRCLFCYDAPCTHACPTHIDIPRFIKKIATGNLIGSARTILEANILGATCARVCPVQELCEGACVLGPSYKPIQIGRLQRYATDTVEPLRVLRVGPVSGRRAAVVGAGPAGLACAGYLAVNGCEVTLFERRTLGGGLSTYGIIALREPAEVALAEVEMIRGLGVTIREGVEFGRDIEWAEVRRRFDAVFLGVGLGATPALGIPGEEHILDGIEYIERTKVDTGPIRIGKKVVVIGAGNTAIDCATIARRLGAEHVTMVYRRTDREMTAYAHEYDFVKREGVEVRFLAQPTRVVMRDGAVAGLECATVELGALDESGRPAPHGVAGSEFVIEADQIVRAIGQVRPALVSLLGVETEKGLIRVNADFETSVPGVYAGGDCIRVKGAASTVMAVQDGKLAAMAIARALASTTKAVETHG